jgi:DnaJ family protein A protein 3
MWPILRATVHRSICRNFSTSQLLSRKDYYEILGVPRNADAKTIKKAYYEKAKKFHPDSNKSDPKAAAKFQEVSEAYEILNDSGKRQAYDLGVGGSASNGPGDSGGFRPGSGPSSSGAWQYQYRDSNPFGGTFTNPEDYFKRIFEDFETKFGSEYKSSKYNDESPWGAEASEISLNVTFKEAAIGCDKEVIINSPDTCHVCNGSCSQPGYKPVKCPYCQGTGVETISTGPFLLRSTCRVCKGSRVFINKPCTQCNGKGQTIQRKTVIVPVPAGVVDGQTIRMRIANGKELYVTFKVAKNNYFRRDDADIHTDATISVSQAVVGATINVEGLYEDLTVEIKPGTSSHSTIRLPQKGIKRMDSYGRGDHYVHIKIQVPEKPSKKQKELMKEFDQDDSWFNFNFKRS